MQKIILVVYYICFLIVWGSLTNCVCAQKQEILNYITIVPKVPIDKSSWCVVEEPAVFPGGIAAWTKYLSDSTRYPNVYSAQQKDAIVRIQFIVSKEGLITEVKSLDSTINSFTEESIRVIKNSPCWSPARRNGRPVSFRIVQGFNFLWEPPTLPRIATSDASGNIRGSFC